MNDRNKLPVRFASGVACNVVIAYDTLADSSTDCPGMAALACSLYTYSVRDMAISGRRNCL